jgi:phosphoribosylamine---glycine ligase
MIVMAKKREIKVLLVGNDARGQAIAEAIACSNYRVKLFAFMESLNPGIAGLVTGFELGKYDNLEAILAYVQNLSGVDFVVISPEKPLLYGVVDALEEAGIPSVGPNKLPAQIETSKSFTRKLLKIYGIPGNPQYWIFTSFNPGVIKVFMDYLGQAVIKPDGLTGGKGGMVQGDHFTTKDEALEICAEILKKHSAVIIEEKLDGEEFSLQCFTDGKTVVATPPVQDHKRRLPKDMGLNTGGMGSYSCADHLLPFLKQADIDQAEEIVWQVVRAIDHETKELFRGILYGGFMATADGVKLIEFNARFGDPEAMNILPLLETDFVDICYGIIGGRLDEIPISFQKKATVCKYLVPWAYGRNLPKGHPDLPLNSAKIGIGDLGGAKLYYSAAEKRSDGIYTTASRTVAVLGIGDNLSQAEEIAEKAAQAVSGPLDHRRDIGTAQLIQRRIHHMRTLRRK